jgi:sugar phosphate isomerase/epimerase
MIQKLAAVKEELDLTYTAHIPLWSMELATPLVPVREGAVQSVVDFCQLIQPLEPEIYVLHATGSMAADFYFRDLPSVAKAFLMRLFQSYARESLAAIIARTGLPSRALAIETVEFPFDLTYELAEELDLSICLDIGHVMVGYSGPGELFDVLEACLPRLGEVHLHDAPWQGPEGIIRDGEDHIALGLGELDTGRLLDRLDEAGYSGPIIFELTVTEALASRKEIRSIRPNYLA